MISKNSRVVAVDHISIVDIGGEAVVLNLNAGEYFGLNGAGARILELIQKPLRISDVVTTLEKDYDVSIEKLEKDVIEFVEGLMQKEIVRIETDDASNVTLVSNR